LVADVARGQIVCTAADITAQEASCPNSDGTCQISKTFTVQDGCTLDFEQRNLVIGPSGRLIVRTGAMTIRAGSLVINPGGLLDGRGTRATATGGTIRVSTAGTVLINGPNGAIDVSADDGGGTIVIEATGSVTIGGRLRAVGNIRTGIGGEIVVRSEDDISVTTSSQVTATGAREGGIGGTIDLSARGRVLIAALLDVDGSDGGELNLFSGEDMVVGHVEARGTSDAGSGGCVSIRAETALQTSDVISLDGAGSSQGSGGGCGGFLCLEARYGDLLIREDLTAEGALPDGGGGSIALIADAGAVTIQGTDTLISVRGNGGQGCGGEVCIDAKRRIDGQGMFDASGGIAGGDIDMSAGNDVAVASGITVSGRFAGGCGGTTLIEAGFDGVGNIALSSTVDISAAGCSGGICGIAGLAQLIGCRVNITPAGGIDGEAGEGGNIDVIVREQLLSQGTISAITTESGPPGQNGTVEIRHPVGVMPGFGSVRPLPTRIAVERCTAERQIDCLAPCPVCGNGVVQFPETCDNGGGLNPLSCDGCSLGCRLEDCDDGLNCTIDSCAPDRGCRHAPVELPSTPCYEPSEATPTATRTMSPTRTVTPTRTSAVSPTVAASLTPTRGPSPSPGAGCTGDCDDDKRVTVNELVRGVNISLEVQALAVCPSFDRDGSQTVTVDELVSAVRVALGNGCDQ
jgi:hypothetical protein